MVQNAVIKIYEVLHRFLDKSIIYHFEGGLDDINKVSSV